MRLIQAKIRHMNLLKLVITTLEASTLKVFTPLKVYWGFQWNFKTDIFFWLIRKIMYQFTSPNAHWSLLKSFSKFS